METRKKIKLGTILFIWLFFCSSAFSQLHLGGSDLKNDYAILYVYTTPLATDMNVVISDSKVIELKNKFPIQRGDNDNVSYTAKLTLAGISYMEEQGYELTTSLGYGTVTGFVKEYTFRRKRS
ncbi:MAG: hypothetical protein ACXVC6_07195 [Bacteroidia bacterium]